ncbi:MAG: adenosine deaminase family protein [Myxococcales bacterium]|nr:adenosine deaminase family protein [Myxococcales bacterium]
MSQSSPLLAAQPALADLHRHLDGSLRPTTVAELAAQTGQAVPPDLAFVPGMGLAAALSRFAYTLSLLQTPQAVARVAAEMCEDAAAEGVTTLEIRFAPQLHLQRGASIEAIVDAALRGIADRAGLILCGLYGEPPSVLEQLVALAKARPGVVGIDLAGGPSDSHAVRMSDYARAFVQARELGLGRTVHAGEGRPPAEIRDAIACLHAQRIGHGTTLLDDPQVTDLVLRRGVLIEACPTSNWHTGAITSVAEHPLPRWLDRGIAVCVCADNTLLSATDARRELAAVARLPGMDERKIQSLIQAGHAGAFRRRDATQHTKEIDRNRNV